MDLFLKNGRWLPALKHEYRKAMISGVPVGVKNYFVLK